LTVTPNVYQSRVPSAKHDINFLFDPSFKFTMFTKVAALAVLATQVFAAPIELEERASCPKMFAIPSHPNCSPHPLIPSQPHLRCP